MKNTLFHYILIQFLIAPVSMLAQTTAFTYQGQLLDGGQPANGNYDLRFTLADAATNGNYLVAPLTNAPTLVSNGLFTVILDFGASVFNGSARWLEIEVRTNGSTGVFTTLAPRQLLTPAPYSLYAASAATAASATTANNVATNSVTASGIQDSTITASKIASGQVVKSINGLFDDVNLSAGANVTLTSSGNNMQIAASGATSLNSKLLNVIFEGDSLTQEAGTGTDSPHTPPYSTYPLYLRQMWGTNVIGSWVNYAVGADELYNVTNRLANLLASLPGTNNLEFLWIGANDFWPHDGFAITNASTWLSTWQSYCRTLQSNGIKLVVFTVTDRYPTTDTNRIAFRQAINNGIRLSPFWDWLVDMDAANADMNPTNNLRTYDGTHANTNGAIWQAKFVDRNVPASLGFSSWLGWFTASTTTVPTADSDYLSFVSRSGITDSGQQAAVSALVSAAKTHGWWTNCDVIYPFVGGTSNSCAQT